MIRAKKKIIALVVAVLMVTAMFPAMAFAAEESPTVTLDSEKVSMTVDKDETVTLTATFKGIEYDSSGETPSHSVKWVYQTAEGGDYVLITDQNLGTATAITKEEGKDASSVLTFKTPVEDTSWDGYIVTCQLYSSADADVFIASASATISVAAAEDPEVPEKPTLEAMAKEGESAAAKLTKAVDLSKAGDTVVTIEATDGAYGTTGSGDDEKVLVYASHKWEVNPGKTAAEDWTAVTSAYASGFGTDTITLNTLTLDNNGDQYRYTVTNNKDKSATSEVVKITVNDDRATNINITVTSTPDLSKAAAGSIGKDVEEIKLSATVADMVQGSPEPTYQWYFDAAEAEGEDAVENPVAISGATSKDYTFTASDSAVGAYFCRVTVGEIYKDSDPITLNAVALGAASPVVVIEAEKEGGYAVSVDEGKDASITVSASTETNAVLAYQWYCIKPNSGTATKMDGETSATLAITAATTDLSGYKYYCVVTNTTDTTDTEGNTVEYKETSGRYTLTVNEAEKPSTTPEFVNADAITDVVYYDGDTVTLDAAATVASGDTLKYAWTVAVGEGTPSNLTATGSSYTISSASAANDGQKYVCTVTNTKENKSITRTFTLAMWAADNVPTITGTLASKTIQLPVAGKTGEDATVIAEYTVDAAAENKDAELVYEWYKVVGKDETKLTTSTYISNLVDVTVDGKTLKFTVNNNAATTGLTDDNFAALTNDTTGLVPIYCKVKVDGSDEYAKTNTVVFTVIGEDIPYFTQQPTAPAECTAGDSVTFTVAAKAASGATDFTYQWHLDKGNGASTIEGATSASYTIDALTTDMSGYKYYCVVTNPAIGADCKAQSDTVTLPKIQEAPAEVPELESSDAVIDTEAGTATVDSGLTADAALALFADKDGYTKQLVDADGEETTVAGTGAKVQLVDSDGAVVDELTIVVKGDLSGSGAVDIVAVAMMVDAYNETLTLDGARADAADMNSDGTLDIVDIAMFIDAYIAQQA